MAGESERDNVKEQSGYTCYVYPAERKQMFHIEDLHFPSTPPLMGQCLHEYMYMDVCICTPMRDRKVQDTIGT